MKKKKDSKHANSSSKSSSRNKTNSSTPTAVSTVPPPVPSPPTVSSADKHADSGDAYSSPIALPDTAYTRQQVKDPPKPTAPQHSSSDAKSKVSTRLREDLNVLQTGLLASDAPENEVVKLLAAGKIRQLLVSDNAALIEEILRRDWVPRLLRWLHPLPTALPPFYSSRRGAVPAAAALLSTSTSTSATGNSSSDKNTTDNSNISTNSNSSCSTNVKAPTSSTSSDGSSSGATTESTDDNADVMPLSKKRKNHEVTSPSDDVSDTTEHSHLTEPSSDLEMHRHQRLHLQIGALWALTNLAAGSSEQAHLLIHKGTLPALVRLVETSENDEILEQSIWIMGNLAGESSPSRDAVIGAGVLKPIINCLNRKPNLITLLKIGAWTLSNICDGQPRHLLDLTHLGPLLDKLLQQTDDEVLSHTCWALSHLCDGPPAHLRSLLALIPQLCFRLVTLLSHASHKIVKPALRTIGNIVCAEDDVDYTDLVTGADAVYFLADLVITSPSKDIQKEACWTLSNIAAGTFPQIQTVLDSGVLLHIVALATSGHNKGGDSSLRVDAEVRSEASWVILNASSCGSDAQIEQLVDYGSIVVLNGLLPDPSMRLMALEGIERILALGERYVRTGYSPGGSLALSEHSGGPAPRNTAGYCACCSNAAARHTKVLAAARNNTRPQLKDKPAGDSPPLLCSPISSDTAKTNTSADHKHLAIEDKKTSDKEGESGDVVKTGDEVVLHKAASDGKGSGSGSGRRVNPFAAQLSVRNLQMMSTACKSAHITKRVTKIFKDHFLSCALCREFFSKHTAEVSYCDECKGHVCSKCDCSKYHLSFQELMWNDLEGSASGTSGAGGSKKSKKKNKKKKNKGASSRQWGREWKPRGDN